MEKKKAEIKNNNDNNNKKTLGATHSFLGLVFHIVDGELDPRLVADGVVRGEGHAGQEHGVSGSLRGGETEG